MGILLQAVFIIAALITILAWVFPSNKSKAKKNYGLFEIDLKLSDGNTHRIRSEVKLLRKFGKDKVSVEHVKLFGATAELSGEVHTHLVEKYSIISDQSVKWSTHE